MFRLCELLNERSDKEDIIKRLELCFKVRGYGVNQFITYDGKNDIIDMYVLSNYFVLVAMITKKRIQT